MKKAILLFDVHLTEKKAHRSYEVVKRFIKDSKPDEIVIGGDFMDCSSLSHWIKDKRMKLEGKRWLKECNKANAELDYLQKYCPNIVYLEGNHEAWVKQYVERNPEVEGLIDVQTNLKLKQRGIKWLDYNKLYKLGKLYVTHGMYTGKYHANKHLMSLGCNVVYGHCHHPQSDMLNMRMVEPHKAWCIGCLCGHEPDYLNGRPANWMNGFGVVYYTNSMFNLYPIDIVGNKFIFEGKIYQ